MGKVGSFPVWFSPHLLELWVCCKTSWAIILGLSWSQTGKLGDGVLWDSQHDCSSISSVSSIYVGRERGTILGTVAFVVFHSCFKILLSCRAHVGEVTEKAGSTSEDFTHSTPSPSKWGPAPQNFSFKAWTPLWIFLFSSKLFWPMSNCVLTLPLK